MEVNNNSQLNILLPNQNAALKEALKNADNSELKNLLQNKNLSTQEILKTIFEQIKNPDKSNQSLLNFLKNSNFIKDLGSFTLNLNDLINNLKKDETLKPFAQGLENFSKNIKEINASNLQENIKNSGIFLESKLAKFAGNENKSIMEDIKSVLLKVNEEVSKNTPELSKLVDRLLNQIETSQMFSLLSNSNYVYIPFLWENLEDGNIQINKKENDDFYCKINLTLKNYGKVELTIGIFNDIDFEIYANFENDDFKEIFKEKMSSLKEGFIQQEINLKILKINNLNDENKTSNAYEKNSFDQYSTIFNQVEIKV